MELLTQPNSEDRKNACETIRDRGWPLPELTEDLKGAITSYYHLHSRRAQAISGAFSLNWQLIDVNIPDRNMALFYLKTWDQIYTCSEEIALKKKKTRENFPWKR